MKVELELWHLITMLVMFLGAVWAFGQVLFAQVDKRLEARFVGLERARSESSQIWVQRFDELHRASAEERESTRRVENDLLKLRAELPERFVMREDYHRMQTIIELKIDKLGMKVENMMMNRGANNG